MSRGESVVSNEAGKEKRRQSPPPPASLEILRKGESPAVLGTGTQACMFNSIKEIALPLKAG